MEKIWPAPRADESEVPKAKRTPGSGLIHLGAKTRGGRGSAVSPTSAEESRTSFQARGGGRSPGRACRSSSRLALQPRGARVARKNLNI